MRWLLVVVVIALAGWTTLKAAADPAQPWENLLQAPSFEEYWQWSTWSYTVIVRDKEKGHPIDGDQSFGEPYFGPSEPKWDKERPRDDKTVAGEVSGEAFWKFRAGYYQSVDAPPGSRVRFSVWVNGFCEDEQTSRCSVILKAGIDPNGGYDWQSSSIRWVETQVADQQYMQLEIEATVGPGGTVTVFTWGEPTLPVLYTAAFFDEASLVIVPTSAIAPAPAVTSKASSPLTLTPTVAPQATPMPVSASLARSDAQRPLKQGHHADEE